MIPIVINDFAGIIPARAGFTIHIYKSGSWDKDHPRSRGVYVAELEAANAALGSSPLARGLQRLDSHHVKFTGIIPARAGFTTGFRRLDIGDGDHPRSRGVYVHESRP